MLCVMRIAHTTALFLVALAPAIVPAATLYKSVDANGIVSFSDMPPAENARILEQRALPIADTSASYESARGPTPGLPVSGSNGEPIIGTAPEQWLGSDPLVAQANQRLDAAERALAEARRARGSPLDGMRMRNASLGGEEMSRIEREKENVNAARRELLDLLRDRRLAVKQAQAQAAGSAAAAAAAASRLSF